MRCRGCSLPSERAMRWGDRIKDRVLYLFFARCSKWVFALRLFFLLLSSCFTTVDSDVKGRSLATLPRIFSTMLARRRTRARQRRSGGSVGVCGCGGPGLGRARSGRIPPAAAAMRSLASELVYSVCGMCGGGEVSVVEVVVQLPPFPLSSRSCSKHPPLAVSLIHLIKLKISRRVCGDRLTAKRLGRRHRIATKRR